MSQNLNAKEIAEWKETCKRQRDIARCNPAYDVRMALIDDYGVRLGPWALRLHLATYMKPPMWNASISLMKVIAEDVVYDNNGQPIFEVPKEGILCVDDWTQEDYSEARDLLGDLMGPLLHSHDQRVIEGAVKGDMVLTWLTAQKDADQRIEIPRI